MAVGLGFLRPREDGSWDGDYVSVGWGTFGDFQDLVYSLSGGFYFISSWDNEDEYDMDLSSGTPPYPAWVSPEMAEDLKNWLKYEALACWPRCRGEAGAGGRAPSLAEVPGGGAARRGVCDLGLLLAARRWDPRVGACSTPHSATPRRSGVALFVVSHVAKR